MTKQTDHDTGLAKAGLSEEMPQPSAARVQQNPAKAPSQSGQAAPRLLQPNRSKIELRGSLESLLAQDHRARLVWSYVMQQNLSRLVEAVKARGSTR